MVVANGVVRNASVLQSYMKAAVIGFALQVPVAMVLWRLHSPLKVHNLVWVVLASVSVFSAFVLLALGKRATVGQATADLRLVTAAGTNGSLERRAVMWVSVETFTTYLLAYCICSLFVRRFSLPELAGVEIGWLAFLTLPALLRVPTGRSASREVSEPASWLREFPSQELRLPVALADGRTVFLEPETVAETVFATADDELAATMFQHAAPLELVRRAIWLGCARNYGMMQHNPSVTPIIGVQELAALVDEAARRRADVMP